MAWENIWQDRGLITRFHQEASRDDLFESGRVAFQDPRFARIDFWVGDFTDVSEVPLTGMDIRSLAEMDKAGCELNPDLKLAIVGGPIVIRGLANMYRAFLDSLDAGWSPRVFDDIEAAKKWISADA